MQTPTCFVFPPFQLDLSNEQLWRDSHTLALRPKTFAVLRYLVEHSGALVTKDALFDTVWAGTVVSDAALKTCIRELRRALGDDDKAPRFIETVHGRGYRFIAPLTTSAPPVSGSRFLISDQNPKQEETRNEKSETSLVGREAELALLHAYWNKAQRGKRQVVFVTGEPGIGKTTVVEALLSQIAPPGKIWIGQGQCGEQYGAGEAYMPVLEALVRLCRDSEDEKLVDILNRYAPTWLVQMPTLLSADEVERLQHTMQSVTHGRMLREIAEALEAFTAERPLILCLEDLHWSDVSTLELLSVLARRQESARLLVLGTYRPVDMLSQGHPLRPLKQELQLHHQCEELRLGLLTEADVITYLQSRFHTEASGSSSLSALARTVHRRTEGNPLFMVNVVDYMTAQGVLGESSDAQSSIPIDVPANIQQLIEKQLGRLSLEEQRVLEVASVTGAHFSAAAVAAGAKLTTSEIEACCTGLVRREQFLRTNGVSEWPDGTVAARYNFLHALYQEVLYERIPAGQRISLHHWIGEREEQAYGEEARTIAAELAVHFERGREYRRAIKYLQQAGENALRRSAHQEAISLLTRGLELLTTLPGTPERAQQELALQLLLGVPLMVTMGAPAPEVDRAYIRARDLCEQLGETKQLFSVLRGLWECYEAQGKLVAARELGEQLLSLAESTADPALLLVAHAVLGDNLLWEGQFVASRTHAEQGTALYDRQQHHTLAALYGTDPGVACLTFEALSLWALGYSDRASKKMGDMLILSQALPHHPYSLAHAQTAAIWLAQWRREGHAVLEHADAAISLSTAQEFPMWVAWATVPQGWALAKQREKKEGLARIQQGLALYQAMEGKLAQSYFHALLAETYGEMEQTEEGLAILAKALEVVDRIGEHFWEAELYRLKGELTLSQSRVQGLGASVKKGSRCKVQRCKTPAPKHLTPNTPAEAEAEAYFHQAIEVAQHQQAKSLELRATVSLARLWQWQGKKKPAQRMLAKIYNWFTEGFDTKDLQEAKALLEELT